MAYTAWGGVYAWPQHLWFNVLHRFTTGYRPLVSAFLCTAGNAGIFVPLVMYPSFFYSTGVLRGWTLAECTEHMWCKFRAVFIADLVFWIPTEMLLFYWVAVKHQVAAFSAANCIFAVILSSIAK